MMSPFDDTAGMASEQSSREVLKRPLGRQNLHNSLLPLSTLVDILSGAVAKEYEAYHWAMSRIRPEYLDADTSDRSVAADVLVREEPDEEEDDEEGDGEEKEGEEDDDEGYSEGPPSESDGSS